MRELRNAKAQRANEGKTSTERDLDRDRDRDRDRDIEYIIGLLRCLRTKLVAMSLISNKMVPLFGDKDGVSFGQELYRILILNQDSPTEALNSLKGLRA